MFCFDIIGYITCDGEVVCPSCMNAAGGETECDSPIFAENNIEGEFHCAYCGEVLQESEE